MFTKADYMNYLNLLAEKERDMMFGLHRLLDQVSEVSVSEQLRTLLQGKQEACQDVSRLFCSLFGLPAEQRRYKRDPALGNVKMRNLESGETATCQCLDISMGGLCVQVLNELPQGLLLALEVRFFESSRPVLRRATVRWCNSTRDGRYRAGLQFEAPQSIHAGEVISEDS
jgi:hypothetical protein